MKLRKGILPKLTWSMLLLWLSWFVVLLTLVIFSYGFIDMNLQLSVNPLFLYLQKPLHTLVFSHRPLTAIVFSVMLFALFGLYVYLFIGADRIFTSWKAILWRIILMGIILVFSYPAFSYDIFNYLTTAKIAYFYRENPYVIMPTEFTGEPYLAFTRAANKVALYGPFWILVTAIPYFLGNGNIWQTILVYKIINFILYALCSFLIYKTTRSIKNVVFFAFNPLVLIEVLISCHNDVIMMFLMMIGVVMWYKKGITNRLVASFGFLGSFCIKGATLAIVPLLFLKRLPLNRLLYYAYALMSFVLFVVAPFREELYPWYAVWTIVIASFMDIKKHSTIVWFSIILSLALELRHIPYMWMGYYEGPGPVLRFWLTIVPILIFSMIVIVKRISLTKSS